MARPPRRKLGKVIKAVIRDAATRIPELSHVRAELILVVAGEARRASRATVRPLSFSDSRERISRDGKRAKPIIRLAGRRIRYVIVFRPMFFLRSTPEQRIETILHELFHVSPRFDGTLALARRHSRLPGRAFSDRFQPILRRYLAVCPPELRQALAHEGEVLMRQWLERPAPHFLMREKDGSPRRAGRRVIFTDAQLFYGPVPMKTERPQRRPTRGARPPRREPGSGGG